MQDHSEPRDLSSTSFRPRTDLTPMRQQASPASSVPSTPTLSTSPSPTLCHSRDGSDASSISSLAFSKLEVPRHANIDVVDPVAATEDNLDQAFARMSVS